MSMVENRSVSESYNQDRIGDYRYRLLLIKDLPTFARLSCLSPVLTYDA